MYTHSRTRFTSAVLSLSLALFALPSIVTAQSHEKPTAVDSSAKQAFALIKTLAGAWQGSVNDPMTNKPGEIQVAMRVTSRGNALVHEMSDADTTGTPLTKDHPVTMMYVDAGKLLLTHYCDAGNRPRMTARVSADGKQVDFDFLDISGPTTYGHMQHVKFTLIDANHHLEEWTYALPNGKTMSGNMDLHRVTSVAVLTTK